MANSLHACREVVTFAWHYSPWRMSEFSVTIQNEGNCLVNQRRKSVLSTSIPLEFGGSGRNFSSTELLVLSLATCIGSSISKSFNDQELLKSLQIEPKRVLSCFPSTLEKLEIRIVSSRELTAEDEAKILAAVRQSPVRLALNPRLEQQYLLSYPSGAARIAKRLV